MTAADPTPDGRRRLAGYIAGRYRSERVEHDDLHAVAWAAIERAVDTYDPDRGIALASWMCTQAHHACQHYVRDHGSLIRIPRRIWNDPAQRELAFRISITRPLVVRLDDDGEGGEGDIVEGTALTVEDDDPVERVVARQALDRLPPMMRAVVVLSVVGDLRQWEVAEIVGCSQVHVSRLLRRGLDSLRAFLEEAA